MAVGRGAQVHLDGLQQQLARGAQHGTLAENTAAKRALELSGLVSNGLTPDGSSPYGVPPEDVALSPNGTTPDDTVPLSQFLAMASTVASLEAQVLTLRARLHALQLPPL